MGSLHETEMANATREGTVDKRQALKWHLRHNHFPPVPSSMVGACLEALEAAREGRWDDPVALPDGVSYRGQDEAPTHAIVEQHHLEAFI